MLIDLLLSPRGHASISYKIQFNALSKLDSMLRTENCRQEIKANKDSNKKDPENMRGFALETLSMSLVKWAHKGIFIRTWDVTGFKSRDFVV